MGGLILWISFELSRITLFVKKILSIRVHLFYPRTPKIWTVQNFWPLSLKTGLNFFPPLPSGLVQNILPPFMGCPKLFIPPEDVVLPHPGNNELSLRFESDRMKNSDFSWYDHILILTTNMKISKFLLFNETEMKSYQKCSFCSIWSVTLR